MEGEHGHLLCMVMLEELVQCEGIMLPNHFHFDDDLKLDSHVNMFVNGSWPFNWGVRKSCCVRISKPEIQSAWQRFIHDATSCGKVPLARWTRITQAAWYRQTWNSAEMRPYWNSFPSMVLPTGCMFSSTKWKPNVHVNHQFSTPLGRSDEGKGKRKRQREERLRVADEDSSGGKCIDIMVFSACQKL